MLCMAWQQACAWLQQEPDAHAGGERQLFATTARTSLVDMSIDDGGAIEALKRGPPSLRAPRRGRRTEQRGDGDNMMKPTL